MDHDEGYKHQLQLIQIMFTNEPHSFYYYEHQLQLYEAQLLVISEIV